MKSIVKTVSILLAAACFMLAVTGFYGIYKANKQYRTDCTYLEALQIKTENYKQIKSEADTGRAEYNTAKLGLDRKISEYEEKAADHRQELAIYTATRSGVKTGEQQLNSAMGPINSGKAKLKEMDAQFQEAYAQFQEQKAQLEQGWQLYYGAYSQLQAKLGELNSNRELCNTKLREIDAALQMIPEFSDDQITAMNAAVTVINSYDAKIAVAETEEETAALTAEAEAYAKNAGYESYEAMKAQISSALTAVAAKAQMIAGKQEIEASLAAMEAGEQQINAGLEQLEEQKAKLDEAQTMLDAYEPQIEAGQAQLEAGKAALAQVSAKIGAAKRKLNSTKEELKETGLELSDEVYQIIADKEDIDRRQAVVDDYELLLEELDAAERSLMALDEVKDNSTDNSDILEVADSVYASYSSNSEYLRLNGILSGALSIFSLVIAAVSVLSCFGTVNLGFFTFLPAVDVLLLALCAQKLRYVCNDRIMWSAVIAVVFALTLFVLSISSREARTK